MEGTSVKRFLFLALLAATPLSAAEPEKSAVKISYVVFENNAEGVSEATLGWGSGTAVQSSGGKSLILTNRHVCPNASGHPFVLVGTKSYPAEWVAADDVADLALVRVPVELPAVELADVEPEEGTTLRQWGFSLRGPLKAKSGPIVGTIRFRKDDGPKVEALLTGIDVEPADSGAGVFGPDGKLVAVAFAAGRPSDGPLREHCVRLADVKRFLSRHR
jgi:S1-C subfamily serine protease